MKHLITTLGPLRKEQLGLILPHEQVLTYMQRKTGDYDRWISGMARLRDKVMAGRV